MPKPKKLTKLQKEHGRVLVPDTEHTFDEKQKYVISYIRYKQIFNFEKDITAFIPVNASTLQKIIGRYNPTLKSLLDMDIITTDYKYYSGWRSRVYGFVDYYTFHTEHLTTKWIMENIKEHKKNYMPKTAHTKFLYRNLKKVEVNVDEAMRIIENEIDYDEIIEHSKKRHRTKKGKKREYYLTIEEYKKLYEDKITMLKLEEYFFTIDETAERVHTNVTTLKRELRSALHFNGKPLYELDCANSQNFLFNILIKQFFQNLETSKIFELLFGSESVCFKGEDSLSKELTNEVCYFKKNVENILSYSRPRNKNKHVTTVNTRVYRNSEKLKILTDIVHYFNLTSEGKYWTFMMEKDKFEGNKAYYKQESFGKVFFSKLPNKNEWSYRKTFKKHFPNVMKIIDYYKKKNGNLKTGYKELPIDMQKAEVDIIINTIIKRIYREHPRMFVLTNHDAIYCTKENVNYIMNVMLDSYYRKYKFIPTIKISPPLDEEKETQPK